MKKFQMLTIVALATIGFSVRATTVVPPSFDDLVDKAEVIFQGNVTDVKSQWVGEGSQRYIVSYVTFAVKDAVKGAPGEKYTLRMFGGEVDGEGMAVADAPKFAVGDEEILFVENNGSQIVPLVGMMFGRYHVQKDHMGRELIKTNEGAALKSVNRIGQEEQQATNEPDLTAADFKAAVKERVEEKQRERDPNR
jgi:hypothetical protein